MRRRPSARLLVLDDTQRVLLFHFVLEDRAFWATPGGGLEPGESFEQAARRELREETGFEIDAVDAPVATREFTMRLPDGEDVVADERLFLVRAPAGDRALSREGWTPLERAVMRAHRWWSRDELLATREAVFPEDLARILQDAGAW